MQDKGHNQINRKPGGVKKGKQAIAGNELPNIGKVRQGLTRVGTVRTQVRLESRIEHPAVERLVKLRPNPHKDARTHPFQPGKQEEQPDSDQRDHVERQRIATTQNTIVHLQHVEGRRQHQHIDQKAEPPQPHRRGAE